MAHPIFYRLAACVNTGTDVFRLHEVSAEGATIEQSVAALGAEVAGPVFWSLYAYYQDAPSEWLTDEATAADCLQYWETETGLPGEAVKFTPDAKYIDLPVNDPVQVGVTVAAVLEGACEVLGRGRSRLDTAERFVQAAVYAHVRGEVLCLQHGYHEGSWYDIAADIGVALGAVFRPGIPAAQLLEVVDQSIATYTETLQG